MKHITVRSRLLFLLLLFFVVGWLVGWLVGRFLTCFYSGFIFTFIKYIASWEISAINTCILIAVINLHCDAKTPGIHSMIITSCQIAKMYIQTFRLRIHIYYSWKDLCLSSFKGESNKTCTTSRIDRNGHGIKFKKLHVFTTTTTTTTTTTCMHTSTTTTNYYCYSIPCTSLISISNLSNAVRTYVVLLALSHVWAAPKSGTW